MTAKKHIAIIGAGPAGIRAAEVLALAKENIKITVYDSKPSAGRKFLVAGKSGLNLTHDETWDTFLNRYQGNDLPTTKWRNILNHFDHHALRDWAADLGIPTFAASSGKVFPVNMKAAPLLRRLIERLRSLGVEFKFRHRFDSLSSNCTVNFLTTDGRISETFNTIIFALGGGSWRSTGSDGSWVNAFQNSGVTVTPLSAANCGWHVSPLLWSEDLLQSAEGQPLKNIIVQAAETSQHGELVITKYGLEGGPIYRLGPIIKSLETPEIYIDLKPTFSLEQLIAKMESAKKNLLHEAKLRWKLSKAAHAILEQKGPWNNVPALANEVKYCRIPLTHTRPIDEAISSAGGIAWSELDDQLMLRKHPGVYCAGEMLDWEAPTGGYLLQACFATGSWASRSVLKSYREKMDC